MSEKDKAKAFLLDRKQSYEMTFKNNVYAEKVLEDLAKFCRANQSCFDPDPRIHAILEGRREVYLKIMSYINLSVDELYEKYGRKR